MTEKVTLEEVGITRESFDLFIKQLIDNNLEQDATEEELQQQLMHLYLKTITAAKAFADALGVEEVQVTLEGEE